MALSDLLEGIPDGSIAAVHAAREVSLAGDVRVPVAATALLFALWT